MVEHLIDLGQPQLYLRQKLSWWRGGVRAGETMDRFLNVVEGRGVHGRHAKAANELKRGRGRCRAQDGQAALLGTYRR